MYRESEVKTKMKINKPLIMSPLRMIFLKP